MPTLDDHGRGQYFAAYVQWINVACDDASGLTFVSGNSTKSRLGKRQQTINSYIWGSAFFLLVSGVQSKLTVGRRREQHGGTGAGHGE